MKKTPLFIRVLAVLIIVACSVVTVAAIGNSNPYTLNTVENQSETFIANSNAANTAYTNLLNSFRTRPSNSPNLVHGGYSVEGVYANGFPSYYCGAYINSNGNLVVMLNNDLSVAERALVQEEVMYIAETENIYFTTAENTYSELVSAMSSVANVTSRVRSLRNEAEIWGYGISDNANSISIYTNVPSVVENVVTGTNGIDSGLFKYIYQEQGEERPASIPCGEGIGKSRNSETFSIGYRAKHGSVNGFITCAHAVENSSDGALIYHDGTVIGHLDRDYYQYSGSVDAAFIELDDAEVSTQIGLSNLYLGTGMASVAQGSNIALWGKNSLYQAGVVLDSSYLSNPTNYVAISDTIKSDAFCVAGDSGGVVFSTTSYGTTGIVCRYTPSGEYSVFVKVWNINNSLGVTNR